jgi:hypothetical protein
MELSQQAPSSHFKWSDRINKGGIGEISIKEVSEIQAVNARAATLVDAASFIAMRLSSDWEISAPTVPDVRMQQVGTEQKSKIVIIHPDIKIPAFQGFDRYGDDSFGLTAQVEDQDNGVIDRGLVRVRFTKDEPSTYSFEIQREHGLSHKELVERMTHLTYAVGTLLTGIMADETELPYIVHDPRDTKQTKITY